MVWQGSQRHLMLSSVSGPPLAKGTMWSGVVAGVVRPLALQSRQSGSMANRRLRCSTPRRPLRRGVPPLSPHLLPEPAIGAPQYMVGCCGVRSPLTDWVQRCMFALFGARRAVSECREFVGAKRLTRGLVPYSVQRHKGLCVGASPIAVWHVDAFALSGANHGQKHAV